MLEFTDNGRIISANTSTEKVDYELNLLNKQSGHVICALFKDDSLIEAQVVPFTSKKGTVSGSIDMAGALKDADCVKLFTWNMDTLFPICNVGEYNLKQ